MTRLRIALWALYGLVFALAAFVPLLFPEHPLTHRVRAWFEHHHDAVMERIGALEALERRQ